MNARKFHNALRIMFSLDEVSDVIGSENAAAFHRDPARAIIRMDGPTFEKVFALIEARQ